MENLDWVLVKSRSGSLSAQEAASKIRGGEGWLDLIAIEGFVVVRNIIFLEKAECFQPDYGPFVNSVGVCFGPQPQPPRGSVGFATTIDSSNVEANNDAARTILSFVKGRKTTIS